MLIYALLLSKCRKSHLRVFFRQIHQSARIDVTLADEETNPTFTSKANRANTGEVAMQLLMAKYNTTNGSDAT